MARRLARIACLVAILVLPLAGTGPAAAAPPKRVLIVVMDQMRPDFVETFDMDNVRMLMEDGVSYPNAYLGHMAAETVISHNVMTTGVYPKRMGWSDEVHRDVENALGAGPGAFHVTSSFAASEFFALQSRAGRPNLGDYVRSKFPGRKFAVVGMKTTAAYGAGGPRADMIVTMSSRRTTTTAPCFGTLGGRFRGPAGVNVPAYIAGTGECGRFYVNSDTANTYTTGITQPAWMYPLDGNRFVPGFDAAHLGGDTWVADAAMEIMQREPWGGMLVSFGGMDKGGHMWGGITDTGTYAPSSPEEMAHERFIVRNADNQLGRLIQKLRDLGQLDETLIVITADHAGQPSLNHHGVNAAGRGDFNWYYGRDADETYLMPQPQIQPLIATGNVAFNYQDTAVRTWLTDRSLAKKQEMATVMGTLPNVTATYYLDGNRYVLHSSSTATPMMASERAWWRAHGQEIVDTMAAPWAADVVGLLSDNTSYGVGGDHGGHQEPVQRIPKVLWSADVPAGARPAAAFRSIDILPTVLAALGIEDRAATDGIVRPVYPCTTRASARLRGGVSRVTVQARLLGRPLAGALVRIQGLGTGRTVRTDAAGIASVSLRPRRSGLVRITLPQRGLSLGCSRSVRLRAAAGTAGGGAGLTGKP